MLYNLLLGHHAENWGKRRLGYEATKKVATKIVVKEIEYKYGL